MGDRLLDCKNLKVSFFMTGSTVQAVRDVSFHVDRNEVVAVVGESGCGKSVTQMSIMQLIQTPPGKILSGDVTFDGIELLRGGKPVADMNQVRGNRIAMIFQEPMTSLNPVFKIGNQFVDVLRAHNKGMTKKEAWALGAKALDEVGIPDAELRMRNYPFELSGGMRQRVLIAFAVACQADLIIADEPTTALDVTVQAQVMELLMDIKKKNNSSIVIVTHNLGLVSRYADRIYVMYAGQIVESGTSEQILTNPQHPYTRGLLNAVPQIQADKKSDLVPIEGAPPSLAKLDDKCSFLPRCSEKCDRCSTEACPVLRKAGEDGHMVACHLLDKEVRNEE
ncbi:MAG: ABC transporter ATP-binding protein [Spirochaetales bacterium]|nr:ABC transporter ATP-binding protein [Spirochaetales bacterium]MBR5098557.1 ABC transporter ATP-binding protein [Spirochaetales bacterium]